MWSNFFYSSLSERNCRFSISRARMRCVQQSRACQCRFHPLTRRRIAGAVLRDPATNRRFSYAHCFGDFAYAQVPIPEQVNDFQLVLGVKLPTYFHSKYPFKVNSPPIKVSVLIRPVQCAKIDCSWIEVGVSAA